MLAAGDAEPARLYEHPDAWVQIIEVPDGNVGVFGQILPTADVIRMVVDPEHRERIVSRRPEHPARSAGDDAPMVIDPICGMTVALTENALTLDVDGTTYGFCGESCRELFRRQSA